MKRRSRWFRLWRTQTLNVGLDGDQLQVLGTLLEAYKAQNYRVNPSPHHE